MKLNYPIATVFGILLAAVPSVVDASGPLMRSLAVAGAGIALLSTYLSWRDAKPYVLLFDDNNWRLVGSDREILIPAKTHGKGVNAGARVEVKHHGGFAECITGAVTKPNGDVLISINADGQPFTGRVVIG